MTVCTKTLRLAKPYNRAVDVAFDAPHTSSDGGLLLLRALDERLGVSATLGALVPDARDARKVTHARTEQVRQRVLQIAMGYEDCNDAEHMRHDPMLKLACLGEVNAGDALSSQPSLSRFENAVQARDIAKMLNWSEQSWVDSLPAHTELVILDVDSTDDPTHGHQQLAMFHGYYDQHMYHPLLIIDGLAGQLISAVLRGGDSHAATGAIGRIRRLVQLVKARFPQARIAVRGDSAFAMPHITAALDRLQLEHAGVDFVFGMARNKVLERLLAPEMAEAKRLCHETGLHVRRFTEFQYAAGTWPYKRRIIGKAEYGAKGGATGKKFNLPDLRGRGAVGVGQGPGLTLRGVADSYGAESFKLVKGNLPAHAHGAGTLLTVPEDLSHTHAGDTDSDGGHVHHPNNAAGLMVWSLTIPQVGQVSWPLSSGNATTAAAYFDATDGAHKHHFTTGGASPDLSNHFQKLQGLTDDAGSDLKGGDVVFAPPSLVLSYIIKL